MAPLPPPNSTPPYPPYPSKWDPSTAAVADSTSPEKRFYYFAYGSNLWREQMAHRCPGYTLIGRGYLRGYRWIINARGYANVIPSLPSPPHSLTVDGDGNIIDDDDGSTPTPDHDEEDPNHKTWGIVYTLTESDMRTLDRYEGTEMKPVPAYVKVTCPIVMSPALPPAGEPVDLDLEVKNCLVYIDPRTHEGEPHEEYIHRMNRGLKDAGLPEEWVRKVIRRWIPEGRGLEPGAEDEDEGVDGVVGERGGVRGEGPGGVKHWVPTGV